MGRRPRNSLLDFGGDSGYDLDSRFVDSDRDPDDGL